MIFRYLYSLPNETTEGIDAIGEQIVTSVPAFTPLLLLFVFFVVFLGGSARQKLRTGDADFSMWAVVASIGTLLIALVLSITAGFIRLDWLIIVVVVTIFSGVWFFLDHGKSDV